MLVVLNAKSVKYSFQVLSVLLKQCCTVPFITRKTCDSPWQVLCTHSLAIFFPWVECLAGCTPAFGRYEETMKPKMDNWSRSVRSQMDNDEISNGWSWITLMASRASSAIMTVDTFDEHCIDIGIPPKTTRYVTRKMHIPFLFSKWSLWHIIQLMEEITSSYGKYPSYLQVFIHPKRWLEMGSSSLESPRSANTHGESRRR